MNVPGIETFKQNCLAALADAGKDCPMDTITTIYCYDGAIQAFQEKRRIKAFGYLAFNFPIMLVSRITALIDKVLLGLGNVLGAPFFNECQFSYGVKVLTTEILFQVAVTILRCVQVILNLVVGILFVKTEEDMFVKTLDIERKRLIQIIKDEVTAGSQLSLIPFNNEGCNEFHC